MKRISFKILKMSALLVSSYMLMAAAPTESASTTTQKALKIGMINFKRCVEDSKIGKQEQDTFEAMKKKLEDVLEEKDKELSALAEKLNDPDQLDLMSAEAETELKRKFRALSQEMSQMQTQYYQSLQQTNFKIVQGLSENVGTAAEQVAKEENYDLLLNDEGAFFYNKALDVSSKVTAKMDQLFDEESKAIAPTK
ncbi:putative Skp-like protein [Chlamydiales bacterium STE3]|nr:putative Skp-like protein [Chlamydiales bacterium STE3]